jgi:hypothetical protein
MEASGVTITIETGESESSSQQLMLLEFLGAPTIFGTPTRLVSLEKV